MRCTPFIGAVLLVLGLAGGLSAQDKPKIGPFVVDARGSLPKFGENAGLAESRDLASTDLPSVALGMTLGAHWYPLRWKVITFGVGGEWHLSGRHHEPALDEDGEPLGQPVNMRFRSLAPQISFNFGSGRGWSYLSGGISRSTVEIAVEGADPDSGAEKLKTINYGGGARWFIKPHVAFTLDLRFYAINPGQPRGEVLGSPRMTWIVFSGGLSLK